MSMFFEKLNNKLKQTIYELRTNQNHFGLFLSTPPNKCKVFRSYSPIQIVPYGLPLTWPWISSQKPKNLNNRCHHNNRPETFQGIQITRQPTRKIYDYWSFYHLKRLHSLTGLESPGINCLFLLRHWKQIGSPRRIPFFLPLEVRGDMIFVTVILLVRKLTFCSLI